jgi:MFS family permease
MSPLLYSRLSALMLFQYLIPGAYLVTLGTYLLTTLNFTGSQVGLVFSTFAVGAVVSPLISGVVADRYMNLEKLLAFCYIAGGAMLWWCTAIHEFAPRRTFPVSGYGAPSAGLLREFLWGSLA